MAEKNETTEKTCEYQELVHDGNEAVTVAKAKTTFVREVTAVYRGARRTSPPIVTPQRATEFIRKILPDNSREHFVALYLDGKHAVIAFSVVATGSANFCHVHPREIFQMGFLSGAVAIIVGHNHPGGDPTPSAEDRKMTDRLKEAGNIVGIKILDHVVVTEDSFYSFSDSV